MSSVFKTEQRRIIPRLRSFDLAVTTGELDPIGAKTVIPVFKSQVLLWEQESSWKNNRTIVHAADLLSSAFVLGLEEEYLEVAEFVLNEGSIFDEAIIRLAKRILKIEDSSQLEIVQDDQNAKIRHDINVLKHVLNAEPKNPIAWMEIGRLYSLLGQVKKADNAVENALYLDRNNRFIIRSASRYYHHFSDEKDKALYIVRKSQQISNDPWLISADIAYSTILGRYSKMAKVGENYVKNRTNDLGSVTELTSALGTLEFYNGNNKEARKYFNQSLIKPNDNSLAQAAWMSDNIHGIDIDESKYEVPLAYEANAIYYYHLGNYNYAFSEAMKWHFDEPFSTRPIKAASYIASTFFDNYKISIELAKAGLAIAPDDILLLNNLVYFLVQDDQLSSAESLFIKSLKRILQYPDSFSNREKVICTATAGLIAFRKGNKELGTQYYTKAIDMAKDDKDLYVTALATANYVKEALKLVETWAEGNSLMKLLEDTCKNSIEPDIKFRYEKIVEKYHDRFSVLI